MGLGFELLAVTVIGVYLGQYIDKTYEIKGLATVGLVLGGLGGWAYHLVVLIKKYEREKQVDKPESHEN